MRPLRQFLLIGSGTLALMFAFGLAHGPADEAPRSLSLFDRLTGGKPVWERAQINETRHVELFDRIADQLGVTDGKLTRQHYADYQQRQKQNRAAAPAAAAVIPVTDEPAARSRQEVVASWAEATFRRYDRNGDGMLSFDELPEEMRAHRQRYDVDHNGFLDLAEFKAYFNAQRAVVEREFGRAEQRRAPAAAVDSDPEPPAADTGAPVDDSPRMAATVDVAPPETDAELGGLGSSNSPIGTANVVRRARATYAGREVPAFFGELDLDGDGQVGLYEWRLGPYSIDLFHAMDRNGDGFLTVEEVFFFEAYVIPARKNVAATHVTTANLQPRR